MMVDPAVVKKRGSPFTLRKGNASGGIVAVTLPPYSEVSNQVASEASRAITISFR